MKYIHVALVGAVSVGKSTLLNAMLTAKAAPMAMARSTAGETIYLETDDAKADEAAQKHDLAKNRDSTIMMKTLKLQDIPKDIIPVPRIAGMFDRAHAAGMLVAIHDLPGLNDARTKAAYHEFVRGRFTDYDVVVFVVDVQSGMNTSDEKDILALITAGVRSREVEYGIKTKVMVVVNKCDEMVIPSSPSQSIMPADCERRVMVRQTIGAVQAANLSDGSPVFTCLSAEDAYVTRMFQRNPDCTIDEHHRNKFGNNAFGKMSWMVMTAEQKAKALVDYLAKNTDSALTLCGWSQFEERLDDAISGPFLGECRIGSIKHWLRLAIKGWSDDYSGVSEGRLRALFGNTLSPSQTALSIHQFLRDVVVPLFTRSRNVVLPGDAVARHDEWFRKELTEFVARVALPSKLRGVAEIVDNETLQLANDVKLIYTFILEKMRPWHDIAILNSTISALNSEILIYLYKILFTPQTPFCGILKGLAAIIDIDADAFRVGPNYAMCIPYRVCAKICDFAFIQETTPPEIMAKTIIKCVEGILEMCDMLWLMGLCLLRDIIPSLEKRTTIAHNYPRIVAAFDSYVIDYDAAAELKQMLVVDYLIQCKARALAGSSSFTMPGENKVVACLASHTMMRLAARFPTAFVPVRQLIARSARNPPDYSQQNE